MALPLRSGDPPKLEDCVELGEIDVSPAFSNLPGQPEAGKIEFFEQYGKERPRWATVRKVITKLRGEYDHPVAVKINGIGVLRYHDEGWEVD